LTERHEAFERLSVALAEIEVLRPLPTREGCRQSPYRFVALASSKKMKRSVMADLWAAGLPVSDIFGAKLLTTELTDALRKGQLYWHPSHDRLATAASLQCPNSQTFLDRALVLDWRIGLDEEALKRLRETLKR